MATVHHRRYAARRVQVQTRRKPRRLPDSYARALEVISAPAKPPVEQPTRRHQLSGDAWCNNYRSIKTRGGTVPHGVPNSIREGLRTYKGVKVYRPFKHETSWRW